MNWILVAFLEPILFALTNVLDSNLTNRLFKNAWALTVFVAGAGLLFVPLIWLLDTPQAISWSLLPYIIAAGFIELFYAYPYYKALQNEDTSIAISLFSLGKIFVPILAFFFIGELLAIHQYLGFLLIVVSSVALTFNPRAKFRVNKSFFYMLMASTLLAVEVVIFKYIFNQVSWGTGFVWMMGISSLIGMLSYAIPTLRQGMNSELPSLKKHFRYVLLVAGIGFLGAIGFSYSISQVPVTVSRSIGSFQPVFVLLYAVIFTKYFPQAFREEINLRSIAKKTILFVIMVIGVVLTVR